jgi:hypothetical protein
MGYNSNSVKMGNKQVRLVIQGLREQIDLHREKIANELQNRSPTSGSFAIGSWKSKRFQSVWSGLKLV